MPTRNKPATEVFYHVFNRGIEKRPIFMDDRDRIRFMYALYFFNNLLPSENLKRMCEVKLPTLDGRECMLEIHAFCLMDNHYHLLLRDTSEQGGNISEFMRKVGTGYTNYFNTRYKRVGSLFQGTYKAVPVLNEAHLYYLLHYIHLNPTVDGSLTSHKGYLWSSYRDYVSATKPSTIQFPGLVTTDFFTELLGGRENIAKESDEFAVKKKELLLEQLSGISLE